MHSLLQDRDEPSTDPLWPDEPSRPEPPADADSALPEAEQPHPSKRSRAERNRQNAQHSTGPRTDAGKRRSRRNALKHGLTGKIPHTPEDRAEIQQITRELVAYHQPDDPLEADLLERLATMQWRYWRAQVQVADVERQLAHGLAAGHGLDTGLAVVRVEQPAQMQPLDTLLRHLVVADRQYERQVRLLLAMKKDRKREQREEDAFVNDERRKEKASRPDMYASPYHSPAREALEKRGIDPGTLMSPPPQPEKPPQSPAPQQNENQENEPSQPEQNQPLDSDESPQA